MDLPDGVATLRLARTDPAAESWGDSSFDLNWEVPVSALVNGSYQLPTNAIAPDRYGNDYYRWWVQTKDGNNGLSAGARATDSYAGSGWWEGPASFFDGREQLAQNVNFLLRVANTRTPFYYYSINEFPPNYRVDYDFPTNYAYAGLYQLHYSSGSEQTPQLDAFRPFEENYLYHNFVFSADHLDSNGWLATGLELGDLGYPSLTYPVAYQFQPPTDATPIPAILDSSAQRWTCFKPQATRLWPAVLQYYQSWQLALLHDQHKLVARRLRPSVRAAELLRLVVLVRTLRLQLRQRATVCHSLLRRQHSGRVWGCFG